MSLISDALRKARQEAARQEAARRGEAPPQLPHHMPLRRPARAPWIAALAGGFAGAALLTAAGLWYFTSRHVPAPAPAPASTPAAIATPAPAPSPVAEITPVAPVPALPVTPEPAAPPEAAPSIPPPEPTLAPDASAVAESPASAPIRTPRRRAELADGTVLTLQGIAITDGRPVALVNGVALGPGERIAGFTVTAIAATEIELRRDGEIVVLALR
ncbi:MAG TPA: hypothetical protein PK570_10985 [Thermoanaerobaculia bacterium]|jgi:hypothetical protein|nr:hypothetical protein [Thermoanaerobaculia bacterium]OQC38932.1 MAG: hypothetical protein BWX64_01718 [Acidobacteria bacterium ADurb.Bin051]MBP7814220.1 hypothetical protein [Thermoanaerobaculia bacterium]MBP8845468.1 hypothetical protein [Thermoanaerobaculia bacterium]HPA94552.1 hypothetical protein [Thermoanaerobaculia bacterium]